MTPLPTRQNKQTRHNVNLPDLQFHNSDLAPVGVNARPEKSKTDEDLKTKQYELEKMETGKVNLSVYYYYILNMGIVLFCSCVFGFAAYQVFNAGKLLFNQLFVCFNIYISVQRQKLSDLRWKLLNKLLMNIKDIWK